MHMQCGLFPVLYTPKGVAYSTAPTLPHVANAAFLALTYSSAYSITEHGLVYCVFVVHDDRCCLFFTT